MEVHAESSQHEGQSPGSMLAVMTVVVDVDGCTPAPVTPELPDPNNDYTEPDDDQPAPCSGDDGSGGLGGGGPPPYVFPATPYSHSGGGLHVRHTTGDVWTRVPIFTSYAGGEKDLECVLRFDSLRTYRDDGLGLGWRHSLQMNLEQVNGELVFVRGNGRRSAFWSFTHNGVTSWHSLPGVVYGMLYLDDSHYEMLQPDGTRYIFSPFGGSVGCLERMVDRRGRTTYFQYNETTGQLVRVVSPYGRVAEFGYNETSGRLTTITDPDGKVTTLGYSTSGEYYQLETITDPLTPQAGVITYAYDPENPGRITQETLENGVQFCCEYIETGVILRDQDNEKIVTVASDDGFPGWSGGSITPGEVSVTDGQNNAWTITRNAQGQVTQVVTPVSSHTWAFGWGAMGDGFAANRLTRITDPRGYTKDYTYSAGGRVASITDQVTLGSTPGYVTTSYEYHDEYRGLLTKITEPDGDEWVYEIAGSNDPNCNYKKGDLLSITDPLHESGTDHIVTFSYTTHDPEDDLPDGISSLPGRIATRTVTDRNGHETVYEYDTDGDLTSKAIDPSDLDLETEYQHDPMGRVTQITVHWAENDDAVTTYTYDEMGRRLTQTVDPEGLELTTYYTYDLHGLLTEVLSPRGDPVAYGYDHRNRRTSTSRDSGSGLVTTQYGYDGNGNVVSVIDPKENETTYLYNNENYPTRSTDAEGYGTVLEPDEVGNTIRQKRERTGGHEDYEIEEYDYDGLNRVTAHRVYTDIADPPTEALETTYSYVSATSCGCAGTPGRALVYQITDPAGKITFRKYDKLDRLTKIIRKVSADPEDPDTSETPDGDDSVTEFEYDPVGNLIQTTGPEGQIVTSEYDAANRRITQTGGPNENQPLVTTLTYDAANNLKGGTLPNGNEIALTYDKANRLTASGDSVGDLFTIGYDDNDNVTSRANGEGETWHYVYDLLDRVQVIVDPVVESGTDRLESRYYDLNGNLRERFDRNGRLTRYKYDQVDRQIEIVEDDVPTVPGDGDGDGDVDEADYTLLQNCFSEHVTEECANFDFDHDGDVDGADSDAFEEAETGELELVFLKRKTATAYDGPGHVTALTAWTDKDPNAGLTETTTYEYDGAARLLTVTYPDHSQSSNGQVFYEYWPSGRVKKRTDQKGVQTEYDYDDLHRLTDRSYDDSLTPADSFGYDKSGRLTSAVHDSGNSGEVSLSFGYDGLDRLITASQAMGGSTFETGIAYDVSSSANQRSLTYPNGAVVAETYDQRDRPAGITADSTTIYSDIAHDLDDRLTVRTSGPGGVSTYQYDVDGRGTLIEHDNSARSALVKLAYGYDPVGNRKYKQDLKSGLSTWSETYEYDGLHRLRRYSRGTLNSTKDKVDTPVASPLVTDQQWVEFDLLGNWLDTRATVGTTNSIDERTVNNVNEYLTSQIDQGTTVSLTNEDNGNLTDDGTQTYVYDAENRLVEVWRKSDPDVLVQTYGYDALGRRVKTIDECPDGCTGGRCGEGISGGGTVETWHVYAGTPACIEEYAAQSPTLLRYFVHGTEFPDPLALVDKTAAGREDSETPEFFWYLKDALGSIVALTDIDEHVVERYVYDPYGATTVTDADGTPLSANAECDALAPASAYGNPFGWTGQRYDPRVGLYHFWFRSYSPALGRWLQRDPLGYVDAASLYQYVDSDPVGRFDPLGLHPPGGASDGGLTNPLAFAAPAPPPAPPPEPHYSLLIPYGGGCGSGAAGPVGGGAVAKLIEQANEALRRGDFARAQQLFQEARNLLGSISGLNPEQEKYLLTGLQRAVDVLRGMNPTIWSRLGDRARDTLTKALNAIRDHLSDLDIKGAIEQIRTRIMAGGKDHLEEVNQALAAIRTAIGALRSQIQHLQDTGGDKALIQNLLFQIQQLQALRDSVWNQLHPPGS